MFLSYIILALSGPVCVCSRLQAGQPREVMQLNCLMLLCPQRGKNEPTGVAALGPRVAGQAWQQSHKDALCRRTVRESKGSRSQWRPRVSGGGIGGAADFGRFGVNRGRILSNVLRLLLQLRDSKVQALIALVCEKRLSKCPAIFKVSAMIRERRRGGDIS